MRKRRVGYAAGVATLAAVSFFLLGQGNARKSKTRSMKARPAMVLLPDTGGGYASDGTLTTSKGGSVTTTRNAAATCGVVGSTLTSAAANTACVSLGFLQSETTAQNINPRSQELDNASWTNSTGTPTITPDTWNFGTGTVGDTLTDDDAASSETRSISGTASTPGSWVASCFFQSGTLTTARIFVNVTGGTGSTSCSLSGLSSTTERKTCTFTAGAGVTSIQTRIAAGSANADVGSIKVGGCQTETGTTPSTYIPTTTAAVSRGITTFQFATDSSWPTSSGNVEVTYCPRTATQQATNLLDVRTAGPTDGWQLSIASGNQLNFQSRVATVSTTVASTGITWVAEQCYKIKVTWTPTSATIYRDGVSLVTGALGTITAISTTATISGASTVNGLLKSIKVYK